MRSFEKSWKEDWHWFALLGITVLINLPMMWPNLLFSNDTLHAQIFFHFAYSNLFLHQEIPNWIPYLAYGVTFDFNLYNTILPTDYVVMVFGWMCRIRDSAMLYKISMILCQLILVLGLYLLSRRLFQSMMTVWMVSLGLLLTTNWMFCSPWSLTSFYLLPLVLWFVLRFLETKDPAHLWLAGLIELLSLLGTIPYIAPLHLFIVVAFLFPFVCREPGLVLAFLNWRNFVHPLFFAFIAYFLVVYLWINGILENVRFLAPGRDLETGYVPLELFLGIDMSCQRQPIGVMTRVLTRGDLYYGEFVNYMGVLPLLTLIYALMRRRDTLFLSVSVVAFGLFWFSIGGWFTEACYFGFPLMKNYRFVSATWNFLRIFLLLMGGFGFEQILRDLRGQPLQASPTFWSGSHPGWHFLYQKLNLEKVLLGAGALAVVAGFVCANINPSKLTYDQPEQKKHEATRQPGEDPPPIPKERNYLGLGAGLMTVGLLAALIVFSFSTGRLTQHIAFGLAGVGGFTLVVGLIRWAWEGGFKPGTDPAAAVLLAVGVLFIVVALALLKKELWAVLAVLACCALDQAFHCNVEYFTSNVFVLNGRGWPELFSLQSASLDLRQKVSIPFWHKMQQIYGEMQNIKVEMVRSAHPKIGDKELLAKINGRDFVPDPNHKRAAELDRLLVIKQQMELEGQILLMLRYLTYGGACCALWVMLRRHGLLGKLPPPAAASSERRPKAAGGKFFAAQNRRRQRVASTAPPDTHWTTVVGPVLFAIYMADISFYYSQVMKQSPFLPQNVQVGSMFRVNSTIYRPQRYERERMPQDANQITSVIDQGRGGSPGQNYYCSRFVLMQSDFAIQDGRLDIMMLCIKKMIMARAKENENLGQTFRRDEPFRLSVGGLGNINFKDQPGLEKARLIHDRDVIFARDEEEGLKKFKALERPDEKIVVVGDPPDKRPEESEGPLPKVEVGKFSANRVSFKIPEGASGWLFYADAYDEGWKVLIDGVPADLVYRANEGFKAVPVLKGTKEVVFYYERGLRDWHGLIFILSSLALAMALTAWTFAAPWLLKIGEEEDLGAAAPLNGPPQPVVGASSGIMVKPSGHIAAGRPPGGPAMADKPARVEMSVSRLMQIWAAVSMLAMLAAALFMLPDFFCMSLVVLFVTTLGVIVIHNRQPAAGG